MASLPIESCSVRLLRAMKYRGIRQVDLVEKTKISKGAISQYLSGAYEPKQDNIMLLSRALSVDPVWLMGYDVPMEKKEETPGQLQLTEGEKAILALFRQVPVEHQNMVVEMIRVALKQKE